ncbi:MAG: hypothetical protein IKR31_08015 [Prevotella sp.]|nr:hypothetical protein [Prevotella sp.]
MKKIYMTPEVLLEQMDSEQLMTMSLLEGDANPEAPVLSREDDFLESILNPFEGNVLNGI